MEEKIVKIYKSLTPACKWKTQSLFYNEIEKRNEDIKKQKQSDFHMELKQYTLQFEKKILKTISKEEGQNKNSQSNESNLIYEYKFKITPLLPESQRIPAALQLKNTFGIKIGKIKQSTTQGIVEIDHSQFGEKAIVQNAQGQEKKYFKFFLGQQSLMMKYRLSNVEQVSIN